VYTKDPCEGEAYVCAAIPTKDRKPVILKRTGRSFWGGYPGHFAADEAVILKRTARSHWSGLRRLLNDRDTPSIWRFRKRGPRLASRFGTRVLGKAQNDIGVVSG